MKRNLLFGIIASLFFQFTSAQDFTGQWKGSFIDKSSSSPGWGGNRCDYVLELEVSGTTVSGYSYTYFSEGGQKFYTICSLSGFVNKAEKYVEIREIKRTKTNVPKTIRNCFQVHKLTYTKEDGNEILHGSWVPAPDQSGGCGFGSTNLQRRLLKRDFSFYNKPAPRKTATVAVTKKPVQPKQNTRPANTVAKAVPKKPVVKDKPRELVIKPKNEIIQQPADSFVAKKSIQEKIIAPAHNFEKRNSTILKTIEVENQTVKVDLYDNGEIDGDSVSLFYNGKLLLSRKRLSDKPITLFLSVDDDNTVNELDMYAENLGTIPPNTALMVVTDGPNRYEVRITSDLKKTGAIRFVHKLSPAATGH